MSNLSYLTTPLYYVNAQPHLGHAYTTIVADVVFRFNAMIGINTVLTTGTDEHGDKILKAADKQKMTPQKYVNKISAIFKNLWSELEISQHKFIRTTDPSHIIFVQNTLQKLYKSGEIYFNQYEGLYCTECERFYNIRELINGKCPDHNLVPKKVKESNYFLKMKKHQSWLKNHLNNNQDFIKPKKYRNEVLNLLKDPLEDLCISRPKSRLTWGIELPFDDNYVTYVWFDALLNYLSSLDYPNKKESKEYWSEAQHIIAKDILKPHAIFWPIILKASKIPIYKNLNVHGYWKIEHRKMSKSVGNTINPLEIKKKYGLDCLRYFLLKEMKFGLDSTFNEENLVVRINSDLANDLGNLFSRTISMAQKYNIDTKNKIESNLKLEEEATKTINNFKIAMNNFEFHKALSIIWKFIAKMNKYIDESTPWALAKNTYDKNKLDSIICNLLKGLNLISALIYPVMPNTATKMQFHLGLNNELLFFDLNNFRAWSKIKIGKESLKKITLFPRIEN